MGSFQHTQSRRPRGRAPGKINASLNAKLAKVEWGEYRLGDLFDHIEQGQRLKKDDQRPGNIPFVMSGVTNTGVVGYISNPVASFPKDSITIDIFGNSFYRNYTYGAGDDTGAYWNEREPYSGKVLLFISAAIGKALMGNYSYGNKLRSSRSFDIVIKLPTKNGKIDFDFIEEFVAELEATRLAELEAYLEATGLRDYTLTPPEIEALTRFNSVTWKQFNLEALFGKSTRGKRLKSDDRIPGNLPFVTAGEADTGISAYIGNPVRIFDTNTVTIDMFGSAKYRSYKYGADDHVAVVHTEHLSSAAALFMTTAIEKSSHNGQFNYSRNFYAKDADDLFISLPVHEYNIDFTFIENLIVAVKKMVIRDVVEYTDRRIAATREVIDS